MLLEIIRGFGALVTALLAVMFARLAVDMFRNGPDEIARRRNPSNYRTRLVGMVVDKGGRLRTKTRSVYVGFPERD